MKLRSASLFRSRSEPPVRSRSRTPCASGAVHTCGSLQLPGGVWAGEQVSECPPPAKREPDPLAVVRPVVQQVAALTQGSDIAVLATTVCRVMVEMGRGQDDLGGSEKLTFGQGGRGDLTAAAVAPLLPCVVPPATIPQLVHRLTMRPATSLTPAASSHEPNPMAHLRPVNRVEVAQLRLDRHGRLPAQTSRAAVRARGRWR